MSVTRTETCGKRHFNRATSARIRRTRLEQPTLPAIIEQRLRPPLKQVEHPLETRLTTVVRIRHILGIHGLDPIE